MTKAKPRIDPDLGMARALEQAAEIVAARELGGTAKAEPDVAAIRKASGLTQNAFALRYGIPLGTLRNWEQGRRRPEGPARALLMAIAEAQARGTEGLEVRDAASGRALPLAEALAPVLGEAKAREVAEAVGRRLGAARG